MTMPWANGSASARRSTTWWRSHGRAPHADRGPLKRPCRRGAPGSGLIVARQVRQRSQVVLADEALFGLQRRMLGLHRDRHAVLERRAQFRLAAVLGVAVVQRAAILLPGLFHDAVALALALHH